MAGPILPISAPNPSTRVHASSTPQSSHLFQPAHSVSQASNGGISLSSVSHGSLNNIPTQPQLVTPVNESKDNKDENGNTEMSIEATRKSVEVAQSGTIDKLTFEAELEEDERTGYARFIGTSFDQTGKLWPEIRKMKVMTLKSTEGLGIFKDLSKSATQYKFELKPGSYLRFVKSQIMAQHRCLWTLCTQSKVADHTVDVAILDFDGAKQKTKPMQNIYDFELLKSALKSRPTMSRSTRFILVEDLSPAMIEALGSELDLDPEFFADHIAGAEDNYVHVRSKDLFMNDGNLDARPTAFLEPKAYYSVTWKRKALQELQNQSTLRDALIALTMKEGSTKSERVGQVFKTDAAYNSNIWRGQELIGTEFLPGIAVAAEERVSVYFKRDHENEGALTVVILFDPIRKYRTELEGDRFTLEYALSCAPRMIHPSVSYQTFHKEKRTYISSQSTWSTRIDFLSYLCLSLQSENNPELLSTSCPNREFHLISVLLHFALTDWHGVLQTLNVVLDKIDSEIAIDVVLQERINGWRHILGTWRKQLINDKGTINAAVQFIDEFNVNDCTCDLITRSKNNRCREKDIVALKKSYSELLTRLTIHIERIERTFAAIMSSMSILESQRAISQAEAVNRVTELAFIFIPLSFAASLFGMQIPEWSENYTPSLWFAISGGLVGGAYLLRLLVRARIVHAISEQISGSIRRFGSIEDNGPVPTLTFLRWLVSKLGLATLGLGVVAASITCVWKYVDSYGGKVAATVILGLVGVLWCLGLYLWRSYEVTFRDYADLMQKKPLDSTRHLSEKEEGKWLSRATHIKLKVWTDSSWKDLFYPEGRRSTVRSQPMM